MSIPIEIKLQLQYRRTFQAIPFRTVSIFKEKVCNDLLDMNLLRASHQSRGMFELYLVMRAISEMNREARFIMRNV